MVLRRSVQIVLARGITFDHHAVSDLGVGRRYGRLCTDGASQERDAFDDLDRAVFGIHHICPNVRHIEMPGAEDALRGDSLMIDIHPHGPDSDGPTGLLHCATQYIIDSPSYPPDLREQAGRILYLDAIAGFDDTIKSIDVLLPPDQDAMSVVQAYRKIPERQKIRSFRMEEFDSSADDLIILMNEHNKTTDGAVSALRYIQVSLTEVNLTQASALTSSLRMSSLSHLHLRATWDWGRDMMTALQIPDLVGLLIQNTPALESFSVDMK